MFDGTAKFSATCGVVREALAADLKECGISRSEVAHRLSRAIEQPVSLAMVDAYVSEAKPHRFPAELVPAWVYVTNSRRILEALCVELGLSIATAEDRDFAELGRSRLRDNKLTRRLWERI